jgi:threonine dehydrogenase-like Zn-dependent dehydrogenase
MKALVMEESLSLTEIERPIPGEGEALIKVRLAGICDTDLEIIKGYMGFEGILGHEFVGVVEQCADVAWLGKRVIADINVSCGTCKFCQQGLAKHCPNRSVLGIAGRSGAFAEYVTIPTKNLIEVPAPITDREAVFIEPLAAALEILEQIKIDPSQRIVIVGDGKLAILIAQVLKLTGCALIVIGKHPEKLDYFNQLGIPTTLKNNLPKKTFSVVVEASGSPSGFQLALSLVAPRGTIVCKSTYREAITLDVSKIVVDEITIVGSRCGPYTAAIRLIVQQLVDVERLVTKTFSFHNALEAFKHAQRDNVFKVLLEIDSSKKVIATSSVMFNAN